MEPNPLAILGLCMGGAAALILFFWLNHRWATRHQPKREAPKKARASVVARSLHFVMSYIFGGAGPVDQIGTEQRSNAVERSTEQPGTYPAELVPILVEHLATLDDDVLLDILALLPGEDDGYRFAESRVAKFIPGRVEDRLTQVRDIRGTQKPPPPGRQLRVKDERGERMIPIAPSKAS